MLFFFASASPFDASWNGGNMIIIYYDDRAGPTEFIVINLLLNFSDYHEILLNHYDFQKKFFEVICWYINLISVFLLQ